MIGQSLIYDLYTEKFAEALKLEQTTEEQLNKKVSETPTSEQTQKFEAELQRESIPNPNLDPSEISNLTSAMAFNIITILRDHFTLVTQLQLIKRYFLDKPHVERECSDTQKQTR